MPLPTVGGGGKHWSCVDPAISLHSHTVPLVQWSTCQLPVMTDLGSKPGGGGYVCETGILLVALSYYNHQFSVFLHYNAKYYCKDISATSIASFNIQKWVPAVRYRYTVVLCFYQQQLKGRRINCSVRLSSLVNCRPEYVRSPGWVSVLLRSSVSC
jgi:hypothetical protein